VASVGRTARYFVVSAESSASLTVSADGSSLPLFGRATTWNVFTTETPDLIESKEHLHTVAMVGSVVARSDNVNAAPALLGRGRFATHSPASLGCTCWGYRLTLGLPAA
jgi:hypothetical protein